MLRYTHMLQMCILNYNTNLIHCVITFCQLQKLCVNLAINRVRFCAVLPYWAIYRRLGYICESFATKNLSSLYFIFATYWATLTFGPDSTVFGKNNPSNQSLRISNFYFKFSLNIHRYTMEAT
jgi:hypothetical protein